MRRRGKAIALSTAAMGLVVVLSAVVASKDRIAEEWWIHKLRTGSEEEKKAAAASLASLGSGRAIPALLEMLKVGADGHETRFLWQIEGDVRRGKTMIGPASMGLHSSDEILLVALVQPDRADFLHALWRISTIAGTPSMPFLIDALGDCDWETRLLIVQLIAGIGPAAIDAVPLLVGMLTGLRAGLGPGNLSQTWHVESARSQILTALGRIGFRAREAIPIVTAIANDASQSEGLRRHAVLTLREIENNGLPTK